MMSQQLNRYISETIEDVTSGARSFQQELHTAETTRTQMSRSQADIQTFPAANGYIRRRVRDVIVQTDVICKGKTRTDRGCRGQYY